MAAKNPITKEIADKYRSMIGRTWSAICFDMPETSKNTVAIEVCLDADYAESYGGPDAVALKAELRKLYEEHTYHVVLKGLSKHIRLV